MISIIIPIHKEFAQLREIRSSFTAVSDIEVILVISPELQGRIQPKFAQEQVVINGHQGRGHALVKGIESSQGDILLFLHADTTLPVNWKQLIRDSLDQGYIGGAFHLQFDNASLILCLLTSIHDRFTAITKEYWGDRAIFVQRDVLDGCIERINIPLMEDIELSRCMRKAGRTIFLKESARTSGETFQKRGILRHAWRIIRCRTKYFLGTSPEKLYNFYSQE